MVGTVKEVPGAITAELEHVIEHDELETFQRICTHQGLTGGSVITHNSKSVLSLCVERNCPRLVEWLLLTVFDHRACPMTGQFAVHLAIAHGRAEMVQHFIRYAPKTLFNVCSHGQSSLHFASAQGSAPVLLMLLNQPLQYDEEGPPSFLDINNLDNSHRTPLHVAASGGKVEAVKALLGRERSDTNPQLVDVNAADSGGRTALHLACIGQHTEVVKTLAGMANSAEEWLWRKQCPVADVNLFDNYQRAPLHYSAVCGDVVSAEILLRHGADVSAMGEPSAVTCSQLVAAITDDEVAQCFAEYASLQEESGDARSFLSSLALADVSASHSSPSESSSSGSSAFAMLSDHFADSGSEDFVVEGAESSGGSNRSSPISISEQTSSQAEDSDHFEPLAGTVAAAAAVAAACAGVDQDVRNLHSMLHGPYRQRSTVHRASHSGMILAATGVSSQVRRRDVHYPKVTALTEACVAVKYDMVKLLLRYGAGHGDKLAAKLTMFADVPEVVERMLTRCHKYERRTKPVESAPASEAEDRAHPAAASVLWSGLSMWSFESSWLRLVENLDKSVDPIANSYRLEAQYTPCVTLYDYQLLYDCVITTPSVIVRLELQDNALTAVPLAVFQLEHLEALNLSSNQLKHLPTAPDIVTSSSAGVQSTASNIIEEATDVLQGWTCLKLAKLKLSENKKLEVLPRCLWFLPRLTVLEVQHAGLRSLPKFRMLFSEEYPPVSPQLKILDLHDNSLDKVNGGLFYFASLEQLNLSNNRLSSMPSQMWLAFRLKQLNISRNRLAKLPSLAKSFRELLAKGDDALPSRCQDLYRERMQGSLQRENDGGSQSLPANLVRIDSDKSQSKPDFLAGRGYEESSLQRSTSQPSERLEMSFGMTAKPVWYEPDAFTSQASTESRGGLSPMQLENLDLSHNHFVGVPEVLSCLAPRLVTLNVSHNYLRSLGPIGNIPCSITSLNLSHCKIRSGHSMDGSTFVHKHCYLTPCAVTGDGGDECTPTSSGTLQCNHRQHASLPKLEEVNLSHNQLTRLTLACLEATTPPYIDSERDTGKHALQPGCTVRLFYPDLRDLSVSHNRLAELTPVIGQQGNLSALNISFNRRLRTIPPQLGKLRGQLLILDTEGLDLVFPSSVSHSPHDLASFLSFLKSTLTGSQMFRHMRLCVVGKSRRGKTTLLERLRGVNPVQLGPAEPTVSIDMLDLELQPPKNSGNAGADPKKSIVFHCWDFAGEELYYSLHQCFLFQRTLFIVVWKLTDGESGVEEIEQWLVDIQSRAPGSPVLLVGTHLDALPSDIRKARSESLVALAKERYITGGARSCHPQVVGVTVVSSTARRNNNMDDLKAELYSIADNLEVRQLGAVKHCSSHREHANLLLSQPIPASYLRMREQIMEAASQRYRAEKSVLTKDVFRREFRSCTDDEDEFEQAVAFCHYQGLILHYKEPALKNLYLLDPSWLCKTMARIICPEGGPRCRGLLALSDLRNILHQSEKLVNYILRLLEKFEVVVRLSDNLCLVQSQLSIYTENRVEERLSAAFPIPLSPSSSSRSSQRGVASASLVSQASSIGQFSGCGASAAGPMSMGTTPQAIREWRATARGPASLAAGPSSLAASVSHSVSASHSSRVSSVPSSMPDGAGVDRPPSALEVVHEEQARAGVGGPKSFSSRLSRLWLMDCFPSGFWPRLLCRIVQGSLSTDIIGYHLPMSNLGQYNLEVLVDERGNAVGVQQGPLCWYCWSDRLELKYRETVLLRLTLNQGTAACVSGDDSDGEGEDVEMIYSECSVGGQYVGAVGSSMSSLQLDVYGNFWASFANAHSNDGSGLQVAFSRLMWAGNEFLELGCRIAATWMSRITHTISILNADWFHGVVRSSDMQCVTPCPMCMARQPADAETIASLRAGENSRTARAQRDEEGTASGTASASGGRSSSRRPGGDSPRSPRSHAGPPPACLLANSINCYRLSDLVFWLQCGDLPADSAAMPDSERPAKEPANGLVQCPKHGYFQAAEQAPDLTFQDMSRKHLLSLASSHNIQTDRMVLGHGGQGVIFKGRLRQEGQSLRVVALKFFHWNMKLLRRRKKPRGPVQLRSLVASCADDAWLSYEALRQEVNMLLSLSHPHVIPMIGVSSSPHCVVLDYAPLGSLRQVYSAFRKSSVRLGNFTTRQVAYQVASALAYLHERSIVYRDMKSDNILAFSFPSPTDYHDVYYHLVNVRLTDHGISRVGGLAMRVEGTAGFIAPEVLSHQGHEPYGPKVDVFAYGMFLYELIAMEKPFSGYNDPKANSAVMKEERPMWKPEISHAPVCVQDVMLQCWVQDPDNRPTMAAVLSVIKQSTFARVLNALYFDEGFTILDACVITAGADTSSAGDAEDYEDPLRDVKAPASSGASTEIWVCGGSRDCGVAAVLNLETYKVWHYKVCDNRVTCVANVGSAVWIGTSAGYLCIYDVVSRQRLFYGVIAVGRYALQICHCPINGCVLVAVSDKTLRVYKDKLDFTTGLDEGTLQTLDVVFMPSRWSVCCFSIVSDPAQSSLARAQTSQKLKVWCGLDAGHVMVYDFDHQHWLRRREDRGSYERSPSPGPRQSSPSREDEKPALLQECMNLRLPSHDSQPCSFVCVTQFEDQLMSDNATGSSRLRTKVWLNIRRRSVVACWTYGSVRWTPFDMAVYLKSSEASQARVTSMTARKHELFVGTGSGHVVILDAQRMCCTSSLSMHGGPVRRLLSLPTKLSSPHANGLSPLPSQCPAAQQASGHAQTLRRSESVPHPSPNDPLCLTGPAMTGHTAVDVFLHTQQQGDTSHRDTSLRDSIAAQAGAAPLSRQVSAAEGMLDGSQPEDSLHHATAGAGSTATSTASPRQSYYATDDLPVAQPCIDASKLHLMFSCDEKQIPVPSGGSGRAANRTPVFMMTWLAGEWHEHVDLSP